jgi:tetratricopeptide (TPR) repeat protein
VQKRTISFLLSSNETQNIKQAGELIEKAINFNPTDVDFKLYKIQFLLVEKNIQAIQKSQNILQKIIEEQPKITKAWALRAQIHLIQAQSGKAMEAVLRGLTYSPGDKNLLLLKAQLEADHSPVLAIPTLEILNKHEPQDTDLALKLAKMYVSTGNYYEGIILLQDLLTRCKENERQIIQTEIAVALYKSGDKAEAIRKFDLLYKNNTNDSYVFLAETAFLIEDQQWDIINHRIDYWLKSNPDQINTLVIFAKKLSQIKNGTALKLAENLLYKIIAHNPHCIKAMKLLALLLQVSDRPTDSAEIYRRILSLKPDELIALNNLAWILCEKRGDYKQALELAQKGLQIAPKYIDLIDTRGVIYYRQGKFNKAAKDFNKCIELYLGNSSSLAASHYHLARTLVALGESEKAVVNLQEALKLHVEYGGLSTGEFNETKRLLEQLLNKDNYVPITRQRY